MVDDKNKKNTTKNIYYYNQMELTPNGFRLRFRARIRLAYTTFPVHYHHHQHHHHHRMSGCTHG